MAADLAADLEEADAEGASAEEVLGSGAFDPRSFAAAWAAERGVIQPPPPTAQSSPRRSRMPAAIAAFALIAIIGAVLAILASPSRPGRLAFASPFRPALSVVVPPQLRFVGPPRIGQPRLREVVPPQLRLVRPPRIGLPRVSVVVRPPGPAARVFAVAVNDSGLNLRRIGLLLLLAGLVGLILSTLYWSPWANPGQQSRWHTRINEGPGGPG
jgi:hypothetical protein